LTLSIPKDAIAPIKDPNRWIELPHIPVDEELENHIILQISADGSVEYNNGDYFTNSR
jgi:hypothetical protein